MDNVLTLISNPATPAVDPETAQAAATTMAASGAQTGEIVWLARNVACDIPFSGIGSEKAAEALQRVTAGKPIDIVTQSTTGRKKSLLVADMESTIIENEMLDELAAAQGIGNAIADITARAMAGELDFEGALRARVAMLKGLDESALEQALSAIRIMPGAAALVATMRAHGAFCALVSGGFRYYTGWVRRRLGFDYDQSNQLEIVDGTLSGEVLDPILGRDAKREALLRLSAEQGITPAMAITVGDGANDLAMLDAAGLGVAYHAKPIVAESAKVRIDHGDLTALLFMQGYRLDEFRN